MATTDYLSFTAGEFALDESFQQWVLHPEEKNMFWEHWLLQHPEKEAVIRDARLLVENIRFRSYSLPAAEKEQLWENVWSELAAEEPPVIKRAWWKDGVKYAAVLLLGMLISGIWWSSRRPAHQPVVMSAHTRLGEIRRCWLPDSSEVTLNANSRLIYMERERGRREVWLDGEAFFQVRHTALGTPFRVHTYDQLQVEVLGTEFNVNSTGSEIVVVLQAGSIRLDIGAEGNEEKTALHLQPGEMIRYNKQDGDYTKSKVHAERYTSWHNGRLMLEDYSLADAAVFMQQFFGKRLIIRDTQLLRYKVSGSMPVSDQADTMLLQLAKIFPVQFNQSGDEIRVQQK
ncbi:FecR family protein [Chitinophaga nivalis]|uniref:FecR domain-containing protein n=1 Tax=Chitinophaga nivalis TaxID=2991709 RepID=A0ABT3IIA2_9BACT|nr:FecR domain-containing protein [Chitinophaga nivalis]MCW3466611.1 FecR domain-containing protein [Chitinophaga nivalis]MCW3483698.1 FecR domain-containing protein [Chitinophaga nivalis]